VAMLAKNFGRLMKNDKFKKKFTKRVLKVVGLRILIFFIRGHEG